MIDLGVNLLALAQRMGHSDPAMTLRLYGHLFEGTQVQLSEKIDELRAASAPTDAAVIPIRGTGSNPVLIGIPHEGAPTTFQSSLSDRRAHTRSGRSRVRGPRVWSCGGVGY